MVYGVLLVKVKAWNKFLQKLTKGSKYDEKKLPPKVKHNELLTKKITNVPYTNLKTNQNCQLIPLLKIRET